MESELSDFITKLNRCRSQLQASQLFRDHLQQLGVQCFTYVNLSRRFEQPVYETTYPLEWIHHYEKQGYVRQDLVILEGRRNLLPFQWSQRINPKKMSPEQRRIFAEATDWGIRDGLAIPVHGVGADFAMVNIATEATDLREFGQSTISLLQVAALNYHALMDQMTTPAVPEVQLTGREREVLVWSAQGKSAWDISQILSISEHTVVYHIEKAKAKLGASTRQYAVVKAILYGLIHP